MDVLEDESRFGRSLGSRGRAEGNSPRRRQLRETGPRARTGIFMRTTGAAALLMLSIALAGCGPEGPSKADTGMVVGAVAGGILGNQVGKGGGNVAATAIGAVVGGIVGSEIGRSMDEQDRRYAQEAEFEALERGQSGVSRQWRNRDNGRYGEV